MLTKKSLAASVAFFHFSLIVSGQITITSTSVAGPDKKIYQAVRSNDIPSNIIAGNGGAAQVWDFSNLVAESNDSIFFHHPDSTAYAFHFPTSNIAAGNAPVYNYFLNDATGFYNLGQAGDSYSTGTSCAGTFSRPYKQMVWPASYGQIFSDTTIYDYPPCNSSSTTNDSISYKIHYTYQAIADGWGTVQLPSGIYNCLRYKRTISYVDTIWSYYNGNPWSVLAIMNGTDETYEWWTDDTTVGFRLAAMRMDTVNNVASYINWVEVDGTTTSLNVPEKTERLVIFPNPAKNEITFRYSSNKPLRVRIFNQLGQEVKTLENISSGEKITTRLTKGIYICVPESADKIFKAEKLIITE